MAAGLVAAVLQGKSGELLGLVESKGEVFPVWLLVAANLVAAGLLGAGKGGRRRDSRVRETPKGTH